MEGIGGRLPRFELLMAAAAVVRLLAIYWPVSTKRHGVTSQNFKFTICTGVCVTENSVGYVCHTASNLGLL
jgi:hypothetical protein